MSTIKTSNFKELDSAFKGMYKIYVKKNIKNITRYKSSVEILKNIFKNYFLMKLETTLKYIV